MITWDDNIRCTEGFAESIDEIKSKVEKRSFSTLLTFCIALPSGDSNTFDIFNMGELLFRYYRDSDTEVHIVGLAPSRDTAISLSADIISDIYNETGDVDVRAYYRGKEQ